MSETAHEFDSNKKQRKNAKFKVDNKKARNAQSLVFTPMSRWLNEREVWLQKDASSQVFWSLVYTVKCRW